VKYLGILQTLRDLIDWESHQDFGIETAVDILRFDFLDVKLCALFIDDRIVYYLCTQINYSAVYSDKWLSREFSQLLVNWFGHPMDNLLRVNLIPMV
jgi:hypothetical protein